MSQSAHAIVSSHKAAARRASAWVAQRTNLTLQPIDALELVACVLGAKNWQTLQALAKKGQGPRVPSTEPVATTSAGWAQPVADAHVLFERRFACGHEKTDRRNFTRREDGYVEERIQALYEGFVAGLGLNAVASEENALPARPVAVAQTAVHHSDNRATSGYPARASAPEASHVAVVVPFNVGQEITVENTRTEMGYKAVVLAINGSKVTATLSHVGPSMYVFDLADSTVTVHGTTLYTSW